MQLFTKCFQEFGHLCFAKLLWFPATLDGFQARTACFQISPQRLCQIQISAVAWPPQTRNLEMRICGLCSLDQRPPAWSSLCSLAFQLGTEGWMFSGMFLRRAEFMGLSIRGGHPISTRPNQIYRNQTLVIGKWWCSPSGCRQLSAESLGPGVAQSRPHLYQLSVILLCEARCFDSEEFHPGRQPSEPDVFFCWLIRCLAGSVGTPIWHPVNSPAGCLLHALLTRGIHAYLNESNVLLVQTDLSALQLNLRGLCGSLQRWNNENIIAAIKASW